MSCWLEVLLLASWASQWAAGNFVFIQVIEQKTERTWARWESVSITWFQKWHPLTCAKFSSLAPALGPAWALQKGVTQSMNPGSRNIGISEPSSILVLGPNFSANLLDMKLCSLAEKWLLYRFAFLQESGRPHLSFQCLNYEDLHWHWPSWFPLGLWTLSLCALPCFQISSFVFPLDS